MPNKRLTWTQSPFNEPTLQPYSVLQIVAPKHLNHSNGACRKYPFVKNHILTDNKKFYNSHSYLRMFAEFGSAHH